MARPNLAIAAYRSFEENRVRVNDALMSQRAAAGLATHALATATPGSLLPSAFPSVPGLATMNRTVADASRLLAESEAHWARMALPYVLSVHEAFTSDLVEFLRDAGLDDARHRKYKPRVSDIKLVELHSYVARAAGQAGKHVGVVEWPLFDWLRTLRNSLVHDAGDARKSMVESTYAKLGASEIGRWTGITGRAFQVQNDQVVVGGPEVRGTLAVSDRLAQHMIRLVSDAPISEDHWADLIVADYKRRFPNRWPKASRRPQALETFARTEFALAGATAAALRSAVARAR